MENVKNMEFKVGVFVGLGLLVLCMSILLLGGNKFLFHRYYNLSTEMPQVQGLVEGSVVSLAGLEVGNVARIQFLAEKNILQVTLKIDREFQDRIREGSTAEVKTQGALGDKFVYLNPGPVGGKVIPDNGMIAAADSADLMTVLATKGDAFAQVFDIIHELNVLMKTINGEGRSQNIMSNITAASSALKSTVERINVLVSEVQGDGKDNPGLKKSLHHLANILQKVDNGEGTLGALINDPSLHESLKALVGASPRQRYLKGFVRDAIQTNEKAK